MKGLFLNHLRNQFRNQLRNEFGNLRSNLSRTFALAAAFLLLSLTASAKKLVSFRLHGSQLYMTMPKTLLGRDMLMASCVRSTTHYKYAEVGTRPQVFLVQWQREGERIALKQLSTTITGDDADKKEQTALKNNFEGTIQGYGQTVAAVGLQTGCR